MKEKEIKTTVVIPNYNGKERLRDCLTFLGRCKGTGFVTLVVDDASTDDSCRMVKEFFPNVRLIRRKENGGFARAVNTGIRAAKTEFVLLLNNDTIPEPGFVKALEDMLIKNKRFFSASAKMLSMSEPEKIDDCGDRYSALGWARSIGKGESSSRFTAPAVVFSACGGAAIYRREALMEMGLFDELHFAYLEDVDVGYRAQLYGWKNVFCPDAVVYHAGSATSGSRYNAFKARLSARNSIYLAVKNMPLLQFLLNLPLLIIGFALKTAFYLMKGLGGAYIRGFWQGVALSLSAEGRKKRVRLGMRGFFTYLRIQLVLWRNILAL